jgi:predicted RNase H-like HicB family nuclease
MTVVEHGYTLEEARDLSQAGLEQCVDKMAAIFASP